MAIVGRAIVSMAIARRVLMLTRREQEGVNDSVEIARTAKASLLIASRANASVAANFYEWR